jgi:hypothetical protein
VPDAVTREWIRQQTLLGYARACQAILDCSDQRIREAALRDWDRVKIMIADAITEHLVQALNERAEAEAEGRLQ